jgi:DGQHR domain-containing protein
MFATAEKIEDWNEAMIPVTMGPQLRGGIQTIVGSMPAGLLVPDNYRIPRRDTLKKEGYQRDVSRARVNKLVTDLQKTRVDLPTAILLNLREITAEDLLIKGADGEVFMPEPSDDRFGPFYVVDGQHRLVALHDLVEQNPDKWSQFLIPFVCMVGADVRQEMEQFYVVNSNAKSVRTDLAMDLLKQRAESDPNVMESLIERGEKWKVDGETIVEKLTDESPVWRHRIRFPNQPKNETTLSSAAMVNSLKQLLGTPYFGAINLENQVKVLDAYWRGIREVLPEAFNDEPSAYSIQKGSGVTVLHAVLIHVLEYIRSMGLSVTDGTSYRDAIEEALETLEGDTPNGDIVNGMEFWRAGPDGAAGAYSSNAARRVLIAKIKSRLPQVEIE